MQKISEEDSQDEEVLISKRNGGRNKVQNLRPPPPGGKPVPPAKPAFLLRKGTSNNGGVQGMQGKPGTTNNSSSGGPTITTTFSHLTSGHPNHHHHHPGFNFNPNPILPTTNQRITTFDNPLPPPNNCEDDNWPSSSSSASNDGDYDDDDNHCRDDSPLPGNGEEEEEDPFTNPSLLLVTKTKKMKKKRKKLTRFNTHNSSTAPEEGLPKNQSPPPSSNNNNTQYSSSSSSSATSSSCSSCEEDEEGSLISGEEEGEREGPSPHNHESHESESQSESSDHSIEDEIALLLPQSDIQSWTCGGGGRDDLDHDGAIFIHEYASSRRYYHHHHRPVKSYKSNPPSKPTSGGKLGHFLATKKKVNHQEGVIEGVGDQPEDCQQHLNQDSLEEMKLRKSKVFRFKDQHDGEIREVGVTILPKKLRRTLNLGRRATLVESLLGILPSTFHHNQQNQNSSIKMSRDKRIMVAGFIPDSASSPTRTRNIKIGDWLQKVNGIPVDFSNVNSVLKDILEKSESQHERESEEIKLLLQLQRVSGYTVTDPPVKCVKFEDQVGLPDGSSKKESNGESDAEDGDEEDLMISEILGKVAIIYISVVNSNSGGGGGSSSPTSSKETHQEVIFSWPKESSNPKVKALSASQGMFSTLHKLLKDVTGSYPVSLRVMIDDEEMEVVVFSDEEDEGGLLLLSCSTSLCTFSLNPGEEEGGLRMMMMMSCIRKQIPQRPFSGGTFTLGTRLMRRVHLLLNYQFGSLSRAFHSTPDEKLDKFLLKAVTSLGYVSEDFLFPSVPTPMVPRLSPRVRHLIEEKMFTFEASDSLDLTSGNNLDQDKPLFNCLGSSLYYKGIQISTHMEAPLSSHFQGWWRTHLDLWGIKGPPQHPHRWEPLDRLILWELTFPHSKNQPCYSLLIGIGNYLLGTVLEPATPPIHHNRVPPGVVVMRPEIGWIQRGFKCLLRILRSDIDPCLEKWGVTQEEGGREFIELVPHIQTQHQNLNHQGPEGLSTPGPSSSSGQKLNIPPPPTTTHVRSGGGILKNPESTHTPLTVDEPHSEDAYPTKNPHHSTASSSSRTTSGGLDNTYPYGPPRTSDPSYSDDDTPKDPDYYEGGTTGTGSETSSLRMYWEQPLLNHLEEEEEFEEDIRTISITKGNVLFDFLQIEHGRGIMLTTRGNIEGPFSSVIHNFRQAAGMTHEILQKAARGRARLGTQSEDRKWISKSLTPICEHGLLFICDIVDPRDVHKKKPRMVKVSYWVVGRIYPNQRELYVCYQDSLVGQNLVEVAFKVAFHSM